MESITTYHTGLFDEKELMLAKFSQRKGGRALLEGQEYLTDQKKNWESRSEGSTIAIPGIQEAETLPSPSQRPQRLQLV